MNPPRPDEIALSQGGDEVVELPAELHQAEARHPELAGSDLAGEQEEPLSCFDRGYEVFFVPTHIPLIRRQIFTLNAKRMRRHPP